MKAARRSANHQVATSNLPILGTYNFAGKNNSIFIKSILYKRVRLI